MLEDVKYVLYSTYRNTIRSGRYDLRLIVQYLKFYIQKVR